MSALTPMVGHMLTIILSQARPRQSPTSMEPAGFGAFCIAVGLEGWPGAGDEGVPLAARASANSGNAESGFQSVPGSDCALVAALARPAAIQALSCSAVTGPYCWPSLPIILYMFQSLPVTER